MLKKICIESLYDVYNYTLDLKPDDSPIRFITGPNGYGKTTILNILQALYIGNLSTVATIPFRKIELLFEDGFQIMISQERDYDAEEGSDEQTLSCVRLCIRFGKNDRKPEMLCNWNSIGTAKDVENQLLGLRLYLSSHPIYYIKDGRVRSEEGVPTVKQHVGRLKQMLNDNNFVQNESFQSRLEAFANIVKQSGFAHKEMQIHPRYGYRLVADDLNKSILSVEKLSSGEQHFLIMMFELLLVAPDDSIVLVDEPEISFHPEWQLEYLRHLRTITSLRNMQCLVCTHSPQIFNMDFDLTVDLYQQSQF